MLLVILSERDSEIAIGSDAADDEPFVALKAP